MKLYGFPASPNTWKVRALASYLTVPLEFEFVDLLKGAQHTPAFLMLNPTGRTAGQYARATVRRLRMRTLVLSAVLDSAVFYFGHGPSGM